MKDIGNTDHYLKALDAYRRATEEAYRLGRGVEYHISRDFTDLHFFDLYKEIVIELGQKPCFFFGSVADRCGKCLSCQSALLTLPSAYTPTEIRAILNEIKGKSQDTSGDQENNPCERPSA